ARVMALTAPLIAVGGLLLAVADRRALLWIGAVLGTLSPNGQEAGPFAPMEQALLPGTVRSGPVVRAFGWYNIFGFLPAAAGAGAAGAWLGWAARRGLGDLQPERFLLLAYAGVGLLLTLLYARLAADAPRAEATGTSGSLGLGPSRKVVLELVRLQALDALA